MVNPIAFSDGVHGFMSMYIIKPDGWRIVNIIPLDVLEKALRRKIQFNDVREGLVVAND